MKTKKKGFTLKKILRMVGLLLVILVIYVFYDLITSEYDVSDVPSSMSVMIKSLPQKDYLEKLHYYESLELALEDTSNIKNDSRYEFYQNPLENQIISFEDDNQLFLFYCPKEKLDNGKDLFTYVGLYKENGQYSQPCNIDTRLFENYLPNYIYDCDDNVAQSLVDQYAYGDRFYADNGNRIFYGGLENEQEADSLTIDGNAPDEIIPVQVEEKTYYFWYYSKTDLDSKLEQIDYSDYTLQQVIDLVNIQYDKAEDTEEK